MIQPQVLSPSLGQNVWKGIGVHQWILPINLLALTIHDAPGLGTPSTQ